MRTNIALIRGINVVVNNLLPMRDFIRILERLVCEDIKTYIQSGNAVFRTGNSRAKTLAEEIGSRIFRAHGFRPKVLLLSTAELKAAIENNPYSTAVGKALHFMFLQSKPQKPDLAGLMAVKSKSEKFWLNKKIFYLYAPDGIGRSKLVARIEPALGVPVTGRNWNTVNKLKNMVKQIQVRATSTGNRRSYCCGRDAGSDRISGRQSGRKRWCP
jgi:uncharacterized protein (DUF1697 family)